MNIVIDNEEKANTFAGLFQHIKLFTEHINIMFETERMYVQGMDASSISIFEIQLLKGWFDTYEVSQNVRIGVHSTILYKVLNARDIGQSLNITYNEDNNNILCIHFTSQNKELFNKSFEIPLMDIETDMMGIPELDCQAKLLLNSISFANIIGQLQMFGNNVQFICSEEEITLCSISQETGKMTVTIPMEDIDTFAIYDEKVNVSYTLTYLNKMCMYSKMSKNVEIKLTNDYPMKLTYILDDNESKITFYMAPKINEDT